MPNWATMVIPEFLAFPTGCEYLTNNVHQPGPINEQMTQILECHHYHFSWTNSNTFNNDITDFFQYIYINRNPLHIQTKIFYKQL